MAAVPITIVGIETRSDGTSENVTIVGMASLTGLGVGGGPIQPPVRPPGGGGEHPEHPIFYPPGTQPHPEHPIVIPDPPTEPIEPPVEWKAIWAGPEQGWVVVGIPNVPHPTPSK